MGGIPAIRYREPGLGDRHCEARAPKQSRATHRDCFGGLRPPRNDGTPSPARPDAELDTVAVAVAVVAEPLVVDATALARRIERVAPADALAVGVPEAARQHPGAGDDGGAVGEMHRADRLAGELASRRLAAPRHAEKLGRANV